MYRQWSLASRSVRFAPLFPTLSRRQTGPTGAGRTTTAFQMKQDGSQPGPRPAQKCSGKRHSEQDLAQWLLPKAGSTQWETSTITISSTASTPTQEKKYGKNHIPAPCLTKTTKVAPPPHQP